MFPLYTLGYSGWTLDGVAGALDATGALLVDTRLNPWSWKAGFKKRELEARFGARYLHVRALGNVRYKDGNAPQDRPIKLADEPAGLALLAELLRERPVVLMCGCADVRTCHRSYVARRMRETTGIEAVDLMPGVEPS